MQPYAGNSFWLSFHITVNRATSSYSSSVMEDLMCWEWLSALLSHMDMWINRSWVYRKWGADGSSEAVLLLQVHCYLVTEVIKMVQKLHVVWQLNPQVFNPVFWEAQSRKKDLKYRAGQPCSQTQTLLVCTTFLQVLDPKYIMQEVQQSVKYYGRRKLGSQVSLMVSWWIY